ncbi:MAG TPA: hypothetical protein VHE12_00350 [bacterium]|nr:hypothetical protein [bacterium]
MEFSSKIQSLMAFAGQARPLDRLERGQAPAMAAKAVAASGLKPFVQGALFLYLDCFDEAHNVANDHEGSWQGNWIHAILHRREPDAGNSKYWYARVKAPDSAYRAIGWSVLEILEKDPPKDLVKLRDRVHKSCLWEPETFVDLCDKYRKEDPASVPYRVLVRLQETEWSGLLNSFLGAENAGK